MSLSDDEVFSFSLFGLWFFSLWGGCREEDARTINIRDDKLRGYKYDLSVRRGHDLDFNPEDLIILEMMQVHLNWSMSKTGSHVIYCICARWGTMKIKECLDIQYLKWSVEMFEIGFLSEMSLWLGLQSWRFNYLGDNIQWQKEKKKKYSTCTFSFS